MRSTKNSQKGADKQNARYRKNRIIVKFKPLPSNTKTTLDSLANTISKQISGGELVRPPSKSGRAVFTVDKDTDIKALAATLSKRREVHYAEPDIVDSDA